jgi:hypothetical protein
MVFGAFLPEVFWWSFILTAFSSIVCFVFFVFFLLFFFYVHFLFIVRHYRNVYSTFLCILFFFLKWASVKNLKVKITCECVSKKHSVTLSITSWLHAGVKCRQLRYWPPFSLSDIYWQAPIALLVIVEQPTWRPISFLEGISREISWARKVPLVTMVCYHIECGRKGHL